MTPYASGKKGGNAVSVMDRPASTESVPELRDAVGDFAYKHGVPEPLLSDIRLAVSEAVTNAVLHAFRGRTDGTVIASVTLRDAEWVEVRVADDGSGMAPRNDSPGIGPGLPLIRHLADQFEHPRPPGSSGTELWMRFRLSPSGARDPDHPLSGADRPQAPDGDLSASVRTVSWTQTR